jgi:glycerate kinase
MNIIIAPDSLKESLSADKVAQAIAKGILKVFPQAFITQMPMADGGEGTVQALVRATNGKIINVEARDSLMRLISSFYGVLGDGKTAVIEVEAASGIELLRKEERNPMIASSYGTGELIKDALDRGYRKFIIGLGGSAMNDAGSGILSALGAEILTKDGTKVKDGGADLKHAVSIEYTFLDSRLKECCFKLACDVTNPLTGRQGASYVFGPQKGASDEMVVELDEALINYGNLLQKITGKDIASIPGTGAAGGIASSFLAFFKTELVPGFQMVAELSGLLNRIKEADMIITAEGKTDHQTLSGKVPSGISKLAKEAGIPAFILTGAIGKGAEELYQQGATAILPLGDKPMSLVESMARTEELLEDTTERLGRIILAGMFLKR